MLYLVTGGCRSGKSGIAEEKVCTLAPSGKRIYFAAMHPRDDEDLERIRKHRERRKDSGFITIEGGLEALVPERFEGFKEHVVLLESLTSLLDREMFEEGESDCAVKIFDAIKLVEACVKAIVIVSDRLFSDALNFDEGTLHYREELGKLERLIAEGCEEVTEAVNGKEIKHKNDSFDMSEGKYFVTGGAAQGKTEFIKNVFGLDDADIFNLRNNTDIRNLQECSAVIHVEEYVRYCLNQGREPEDIFAGIPIVAGDDIFCGIVPLEKKDRIFRDTCGDFYRKLVKDRILIRVVCGIGERI